MTGSQAPAILSQIAPILHKYGGGSRSDLLPILHEVQAELGWLPAEALEAVGQTLRVPLADIQGVVEFYTMYYNQPVGEKIIRICTDPSCAALGGEEVLEAACQRAGVEEGGTSSDGTVTVERMTCLGLCDQAPAALVDDIPMAHATPDDIDTLFDTSETSARLQVTGVPQVLTASIGQLDPLDLVVHRKSGLFTGLDKVLDIGPDAIIEELKKSGLVGRGGAAFPTGLKWQFTRGAQSNPKYVVCNADESEPGTFKDRVLMEGHPYAVLEGMIIAGVVIGSHDGYLFVRGEYPLAFRTIQKAINRCYEAGLLGDNILGSGYRFDIHVRQGAGAYICGEETALFEAIEGKRGFPRVKPPFPTTNGLFSLPTVINNVETLAQAAYIVRHGSEWFKQYGTEDSPGLKLFAVSGNVCQPGIVEAPFGLTIREMIEDHCGGFDGEPKAVLMGGAAGVFLTPDHLDIPLTYEDLRPLGASVGSGAIMVFNQSVDVRDVLRQLAHFFAHESCGKCYPCQLGTRRQLEILERVSEGEANAGDKSLLIDIGVTMTDASICGLGQTAAMAVMNAIELWPELVEPNEK